MKKEKIYINGIPSIIWGERSNKVFIAVHGNMSNKEDVVIELFASKVVDCGYQVISFDLPEHGDRKDNKEYLCNVQNSIKDLRVIMEYVKSKYSEINLWACSMGAYFSMLAYKDENIKNSIFLSPVVDMKIIIDKLMIASNISEAELEEKKIIETSFGQTLYWDYYKYVKENPIKKWDSNTSVLWGSNDNLQDEYLMWDYCKGFKWTLVVFKGGEHYFHTEEQLDFYKDWIDIVIMDICEK